MPIIMQPGLPIKILAREPQIILHHGSSDIDGSKRAVIAPPGDLPVVIGQGRGRSQVVGMVKMRVHPAESMGDHGQRQVIQVNVLLKKGAVGLGLADQVAVQVLVEQVGPVSDALLGTLAKAVVPVRGNDRSVLFDRNKPIVLEIVK